MSELPADPPKPTAPLTADDLATLNDEIAAMAKAGLPLDQGLAVLAKEMGRGKLRDVTAKLADDLRAGKTLPDALAAQQTKLPPFYASLVAAGIRSGRLNEVLATLTTYARTMSELRDTVVNSLTYPGIVFLFGLIMIVGCVTWVGPMFEDVHKSFRLRLPWATRMVAALMHHPYWYVVFPILGLFAAVVLTRYFLTRTEAGRVKWAKFVYSIPLVGTLIRSARLASFAELLALLLEYRVPLAEAFHLAATASADPLLRSESAAIRGRLESGQTLSAALRDRWLVPDFVVWLASAGERNQRLPETLRQTAQHYQRRAESRASLFRNVLPSVTIAVVAVFLLLLMTVIMIVPMLQLLEGLSGGKM